MHQIDLCAAGCQHDDRDRGKLPDAETDCVAIELGQHEVKDDQFRSLGLYYGDGLAAIGCGQNLVPRRLEVGPDQPQYVGFIIDDKDGRFSGHSLTPAAVV